MCRVVHFEIHAEDTERAARFYGDVFGWKFDKWEGPMEYWMVTTGPDSDDGINGGMMQRITPLSGAGFRAFVCTVSVENLDETTSKVVDAGGETLMPRTPVPGIGWMGQYADTEGNVFGAMQNDPNAA